MMILQQTRGALSSGDQLALDLPFAETKSIAARVGPTPTFTRGSSATFVGSNGLIQSAGNNVARFDHNPANPTICRGLLIEEGRTNTCRQSENFGTTWTDDVGLVAISVDQTTSPSGAMDADKISENTTTSNRRICIQAQTFVSGTTYTFSCFVKAAERNFVQLRFGSTFGGQFQNFIVGGVNAGTIGSGTGATAAIQAYPNGWYRCSITATSATTGSSTITIGPQVSSTALAWQPYVGTLGSGIFVWGAQNEAGSFPTSYIPTTTSALARSADVCGITNTAPFWNSSEFTVFTNANFVTSGVDAYASNFNITGGFFGARRINTNNAVAIIRSSGVNADIGFGSFATGSMRMAVAHTTGQQAASLNGGSVSQSSSAFVPTSNPIFNIGASNTSASSAINGHIVAIRYYRKRLANAKLQALTV